ncbi:hypothetical protein IJ22_18680 [Paenibacillus naphthalenovorans]|uniref:Uncharacterized protein n=2 Tax=Paenibacillus naphthalenovorans TaxID=162209 RepID=A0A0U2KZ13_9BACL|nr:hypothetical protein IJ22_18680 [Paenibacillus naphthalenovorans]
MFIITSVVSKDGDNEKVLYGERNKVMERIKNEYTDYIAGTSFFETRHEMNVILRLLPNNINFIDCR